MRLLLGLLFAIMGSSALADEPFVIPDLDKPTFGMSAIEKADFATIAKIKPSHKNRKGVVISSVQSDGIVGLQIPELSKGDLISKVNDSEIETLKDITAAFEACQPSEILPLKK